MVILTSLEKTLSVRWIGPDEGLFEDIKLANLNTPEDLLRLGIPASTQPA